MKTNLQTTLNTATGGATGLNKAGLFARVAPGNLSVNVGRGGIFYNRFAH